MLPWRMRFLTDLCVPFEMGKLNLAKRKIDRYSFLQWYIQCVFWPNYHNLSQSHPKWLFGKANPPKIPWFRFRIRVVCTDILLPRIFSGEFLRKRVKSHHFFFVLIDVDFSIFDTALIREIQQKHCIMGFMEHVNFLNYMHCFFYNPLGVMFSLDIGNSYRQQTSIGFIEYLRTSGFANESLSFRWFQTSFGPIQIVIHQLLWCWRGTFICKPFEWWLIVQFFKNTPPKINVEPQNEGLEDVFPFQNGDFHVLC